jgi:hypothetical protein
MSYGFPNTKFKILGSQGGDYLEFVFWNLKHYSSMYQTTWDYISQDQYLNN